jgi:hypothetical protein
MIVGPFDVATYIEQLQTEVSVPSVSLFPQQLHRRSRRRAVERSRRRFHP